MNPLWSRCFIAACILLASPPTALAQSAPTLAGASPQPLFDWQKSQTIQLEVNLTSGSHFAGYGQLTLDHGSPVRLPATIETTLTLDSQRDINIDVFDGLFPANYTGKRPLQSSLHYVLGVVGGLPAVGYGLSPCTENEVSLVRGSSGVWIMNVPVDSVECGWDGGAAQPEIIGDKITLKSSPNAALFIGDSLMGQTPMEVMLPFDKEVEVKFDLPGYIECQRKLRLARANTTTPATFYVDKERIQPGAPGWNVVSCKLGRP